MAQNSNHLSKMQKRLKLLRQIRTLEKKYTDLTKVPSWVPKLEEIHVLFPKERCKKEGILYPSKLTEIQIFMIKDKVTKMVQEGYSVSEIAQKNRITETWTREIIKERGLKIIKPFKYLIEEKGYYLYATSKTALLKYYAKYTNDSAVCRKLEEEHHVQQGKFYWYQIPVGSRYIVPGSYRTEKNKFFIKIK